MSSKKSLIISWVVLILTVPWWFSTVSNKWFGLPDWGLYAMAAAIIYSLVLSFIIQTVWKTPKDE